MDQRPAYRAGGRRRRVAIARSIVSHPEIMLYDSPTAGLDPVTAHNINILLAKLRDVQHVTSLMVTHRLQDAFTLANFVYSAESQQLVPVDSNGGRERCATCFLILRDGGIYFLGNEPELTASPDPYLRRFLA